MSDESKDPALHAELQAQSDAHDAEIDDLFDELDTLLKNSDVGATLAERGVNVSLAIVAADGLRAYLHGDKERAAEELSTAAEEIATRLAASLAESSRANGGGVKPS